MTKNRRQQYAQWINRSDALELSIRARMERDPLKGLPLGDWIEDEKRGV